MFKRILYHLFRLFPIKKNRVLFISYYGAQYGCNPKYISQKLIDIYGDEVEDYWALTNPNAYVIPGVKAIKFNSITYWYVLATAHVICTNYRMTNEFEKRNGQIYIQTWHSSLRLKKIEKDTEATLPQNYLNMAKHDSAQTDFVIAGCQMSHDTFANSFWYNGEILDIGTPRNDLLISGSDYEKTIIKQRIIKNPNKHIVLYAPTFRKDKSIECYNLDFKALCSVLEKCFAGDWVVLIRLHPHLINHHLFENTPNIVDVTSYDDIQELLFISDILISDYSSLMFDFAVSKKPVFLYAADIDDYTKNDRAFYFKIKELPFTMANNNMQLINNIQNFNENEYLKGIDEFNKKVGSFEHGKASEKIAQMIYKIINS